MSKIVDVIGHPIGLTALKLELILDTHTYSQTLHSNDKAPSTNKAINVIKRLVRPHINGLLFKHIAHLDKLISDVLETAQGHTGGFNISFALSTLLWEASVKEQQNDESELLTRYSIPTSQKLPAYIFSLLNGEDKDNNGFFSEFMIIIRRNTEFNAAHKMYTKIQESLHKVHTTTNTDTIEAIISKIKENNYLYNHDIFVGIKADLAKNQQDNVYRVPDIIEDLDDITLIDYFRKIVKTYELLIIENPLKSYNQQFYEELENTIGHDTLVGITSGINTISDSMLKRAIKNKSISICFLDTDELGSVTQLCELAEFCHKHKVKLCISTHSQSETMNHVITGLNPEFIKYKTKHT